MGRISLKKLNYFDKHYEADNKAYISDEKTLLEIAQDRNIDRITLYRWFKEKDKNYNETKKKARLSEFTHKVETVCKGNPSFKSMVKIAKVIAVKPSTLYRCLRDNSLKSKEFYTLKIPEVLAEQDVFLDKKPPKPNRKAKPQSIGDNRNIARENTISLEQKISIRNYMDGLIEITQQGAILIWGANIIEKSDIVIAITIYCKSTGGEIMEKKTNEEGFPQLTIDATKYSGGELSTKERRTKSTIIRFSDYKGWYLFVAHYYYDRINVCLIKDSEQV